MSNLDDYLKKAKAEQPKGFFGRLRERGRTPVEPEDKQSKLPLVGKHIDKANDNIGRVGSEFVGSIRETAGNASEVIDDANTFIETEGVAASGKYVFDKWQDMQKGISGWVTGLGGLIDTEHQEKRHIQEKLGLEKDWAIRLGEMSMGASTDEIVEQVIEQGVDIDDLLARDTKGTDDQKGYARHLFDTLMFPGRDGESGNVGDLVSSVFDGAFWLEEKTGQGSDVLKEWLTTGKNWTLENVPGLRRLHQEVDNPMQVEDIDHIVDDEIKSVEDYLNSLPEPKSTSSKYMDVLSMINPLAFLKPDEKSPEYDEYHGDMKEALEAARFRSLDILADMYAGIGRKLGGHIAFLDEKKIYEEAIKLKAQADERGPMGGGGLSGEASRLIGGAVPYMMGLMASYKTGGTAGAKGFGAKKGLASYKKGEVHGSKLWRVIQDASKSPEGVAAGVKGSKMASFGYAQLTESERAYQIAISYGADPFVATVGSEFVGAINGALAVLQAKHIMDVGDKIAPNMRGAWWALNKKNEAALKQKAYANFIHKLDNFTTETAKQAEKNLVKDLSKDGLLQQLKSMSYPTIKHMGFEAVQEAMQEGVQAKWEGMWREMPSRELAERVVHGAIAGAFVGGVFGVGRGMLQGRKATPDTSIRTTEVETRQVEIDLIESRIDTHTADAISSQKQLDAIIFEDIGSPYHDTLVKMGNEVPLEASLSDPETGKTYQGPSHIEAMMNAYRQITGSEPSSDPRTPEGKNTNTWMMENFKRFKQGFLTNKNQWIDRETAYALNEIGRKELGITEDAHAALRPGQLQSEDVAARSPKERMFWSETRGEHIEGKAYARALATDKDSLGWSDDVFRDFKTEVIGKESLGDMSPNEVDVVIGQLRKLAATHEAKILTEQIRSNDRLSKPVPKHGLTEREGVFPRLGEKIAAFHYDAIRMERLLDSLDGHTRGPFTKHIWEPWKRGTMVAQEATNARTKDMISEFETLGMTRKDIVRFMNEPVKVDLDSMDSDQRARAFDAMAEIDYDSPDGHQAREPRVYKPDATPYTRLNNWLRDARAARNQQTEAMHQELGRRVGKAEAIAKETGSMQESTKALHGDLKPEMHLETGLTPQDVSFLEAQLNQAPLPYFDKLNAWKALQKVKEGAPPTPGETKALKSIFLPELFVDSQQQAGRTIPRTQGFSDGELQALPDMSQADRVGAYLLMHDDIGLRTLMENNGFTVEQLATLAGSITDNESKMTQWILDNYSKDIETIQHIHRITHGTEIQDIRRVVPVIIKDENSQLLFDQESIFNRLAEGEEGIYKGKPRPVRLNAIETYLYASSMAEHYKALTPPHVQLQRFLSDPQLQNHIDGATHNQGTRLLQKWMEDSRRGYLQRQHTWVGNMFEVLRKKGATSALGFNLISAMRQPLSSFTAAATDPKMVPAMTRNFAEMANDHDAFKAFVHERSQVVRTRVVEREMRSLEQGRKLEKRLLGKEGLSEKSMGLIRMMDAYTVDVVWKSAYDVALAKGQSEADAMRHADKVVMRTQPMGDVIDLPEHFRGDALARIFSTFKNQVNQNYNFWAHDIIGEARAGKLSAGEVSWRILASYILPAYFLGAIGRGELWPKEDATERIAKDLITMPVGSIFFFGDVINTFDSGFSHGDHIAGSGLRETEKALGRINRMAERGEITERDVELLTKYVLKSVGHLTGVPTSQPWRTYEGLKALVEGDTTDLREVLYSPWSLHGGPRPSKKKQQEAQSGPPRLQNYIIGDQEMKSHKLRPGR